MNKIFENRLLMGLMSIPIICWGPGLYLPTDWVGKFASFLIFVFGSLSLFQRARPIYEIVWLGRRDEMEPSSHWGVVGDFLIAVGFIYSGAFGLWWLWAGQPDGWSGTMYSSFGRILMGFGLAANFKMAQGSGPRGVAIDGKTWIFAAMIAAFIAGMIFMGQLKVSDQWPLPFKPDRPSCPSGYPIWGTGHKTFHTPNSPYRALVIPSACFQTEEEATQSGYSKVE